MLMVALDLVFFLLSTVDIKIYCKLNWISLAFKASCVFKRKVHCPRHMSTYTHTQTKPAQYLVNKLKVQQFTFISWLFVCVSVCKRVLGRQVVQFTLVNVVPWLSLAAPGPCVFDLQVVSNRMFEDQGASSAPAAPGTHPHAQLWARPTEAARRCPGNPRGPDSLQWERAIKDKLLRRLCPHKQVTRETIDLPLTFTVQICSFCQTKGDEIWSYNK